MKKANNSDILTQLDEIMFSWVRKVESDQVKWLRNLRRTACRECGRETIFDLCIECQKAESENSNECE